MQWHTSRWTHWGSRVCDTLVDSHMNGSYTMLSTHSRDVWDGTKLRFLFNTSSYIKKKRMM